MLNSNSIYEFEFVEFEFYICDICQIRILHMWNSNSTYVEFYISEIEFHICEIWIQHMWN